jgi:glycosyltransferase involved in cell wall biosynthesis
MKNKQSLLFVSLSSIDSNASASLRNKNLITGFSSNNFSITILTLNSPANSIYKDETFENLTDIEVIRINLNVANKNISNKVFDFLPFKNLLKNLVKFFFRRLSPFDRSIFDIKSFNLKDLPLQDYDIVVSSSDPKTSHLLVKRLIKKGLKYGKWIQYWGDPYTIDITKTTIIPFSLYKFIEGEILSWADKIVYVSPITLKEQIRIFPNLKSKLFFIPPPVSLDSKEKKTVNLKKNFTIGYFGDYPSRVRNIMPFFNFIDRSDFHFIIAGSSNLKLTKKINLSLYSRLNRKTISDLENHCDILIVVLNITGTQIPGKVYQYCSTNKPILIILDGENSSYIKDYLSEYNRFYFCFNSVQSIESAIINIFNSYTVFKPLNHFSPERISRKFIDL